MSAIFHLPSWSYTLLIYSVWFLVPYSWLYCAYHLLALCLRQRLLTVPLLERLFESQRSPNVFLLTYATLEVVFSIYYYLQARAIQARLYRLEHSFQFLYTCISKVATHGLGLIDLDLPDPHHHTPSGENLFEDQLNGRQLARAISRATHLQPQSHSSSPPQSPPLSRSANSSSQLSSPPTSASSSSCVEPQSHHLVSLTTTSSTHRSTYPVSSSATWSTYPLSFDDPRAVDFRTHQVVWFGNCNWDEIRRENFIEWLAWSLFNMHPHELSKGHSSQTSTSRIELINYVLSLFENRAGVKLPTGYNPRLRGRVMRLTLDPIKVGIHPFGFYALVNGASFFVKRMMIKKGFIETQCLNRVNALRYLIRKPAGWDQAPPHLRPIPFIFIHGLGVGKLTTISAYVCLSPLFRSPSSTTSPLTLIHCNLSRSDPIRCFS